MGKKIPKFLEELEEKLKLYQNKRVQIRVRVEIFKNTKSKKFFMWAKDQNVKETWNVNVDLSDQSDSELTVNSIRGLLRDMQREVCKESLKSFEHLSEGVGDDFKLILSVINN